MFLYPLLAETHKGTTGTAFRERYRVDKLKFNDLPVPSLAAQSVSKRKKSESSASLPTNIIGDQSQKKVKLSSNTPRSNSSSQKNQSSSTPKARTSSNTNQSSAKATAAQQRMEKQIEKKKENADEDVFNVIGSSTVAEEENETRKYCLYRFTFGIFSVCFALGVCVHVFVA